MSDAPEKIWTNYRAANRLYLAYDEPPMSDDGYCRTSYTRTDISGAAIAAARAEGVREGLTVACKYITDPGSRLAIETAIRAAAGDAP